MFSEDIIERLSLNLLLTIHYILNWHVRKIEKIFIITIYILFDSSVPTPALTDDITVNWEPLTPAKNQIYRIDLKQSMDAEHNLDRIKYVMEIIVVFLNEKYNILILVRLI